MAIGPSHSSKLGTSSQSAPASKRSEARSSPAESAGPAAQSQDSLLQSLRKSQASRLQSVIGGLLNDEESGEAREDRTLEQPKSTESQAQPSPAKTGFASSQTTELYNEILADEAEESHLEDVEDEAAEFAAEENADEIAEDILKISGDKGEQEKRKRRQQQDQEEEEDEVKEIAEVSGVKTSLPAKLETTTLSTAVQRQTQQGALQESSTGLQVEPTTTGQASSSAEEQQNFPALTPAEQQTEEGAQAGQIGMAVQPDHEETEHSIEPVDGNENEEDTRLEVEEDEATNAQEQAEEEYREQVVEEAKLHAEEIEQVEAEQHAQEEAAQEADLQADNESFKTFRLELEADDVTAQAERAQNESDLIRIAAKDKLEEAEYRAFLLRKKAGYVNREEAALLEARADALVKRAKVGTAEASQTKDVADFASSQAGQIVENVRLQKEQVEKAREARDEALERASEARERAAKAKIRETPKYREKPSEPAEPTPPQGNKAPQTPGVDNPRNPSPGSGQPGVGQSPGPALPGQEGYQEGSGPSLPGGPSPTMPRPEVVGQGTAGQVTGPPAATPTVGGFRATPATVVPPRPAPTGRPVVPTKSLPSAAKTSANHKQISASRARTAQLKNLTRKRREMRQSRPFPKAPRRPKKVSQRFTPLPKFTNLKSTVKAAQQKTTQLLAKFSRQRLPELPGSWSDVSPGSQGNLSFVPPDKTETRASLPRVSRSGFPQNVPSLRTIQKKTSSYAFFPQSSSRYQNDTKLISNHYGCGLLPQETFPTRSPSLGSFGFNINNCKPSSGGGLLPTFPSTKIPGITSTTPTTILDKSPGISSTGSLFPEPVKTTFSSDLRDKLSNLSQQSAFGSSSGSLATQELSNSVTLDGREIVTPGFGGTQQANTSARHSGEQGPNGQSQLTPEQSKEVAEKEQTKRAQAKQLKAKGQARQLSQKAKIADKKAKRAASALRSLKQKMELLNLRFAGREGSTEHRAAKTALLTEARAYQVELKTQLALSRQLSGELQLQQGALHQLSTGSPAPSKKKEVNRATSSVRKAPETRERSERRQVEVPTPSPRPQLPKAETKSDRDEGQLLSANESAATDQTGEVELQINKARAEAFQADQEVADASFALEQRQLEPSADVPVAFGVQQLSLAEPARTKPTPIEVFSSETEPAPETFSPDLQEETSLRLGDAVKPHPSIEAEPLKEIEQTVSSPTEARREANEAENRVEAARWVVEQKKATRPQVPTDLSRKKTESSNPASSQKPTETAVERPKRPALEARKAEPNGAKPEGQQKLEKKSAEPNRQSSSASAEVSPKKGVQTPEPPDSISREIVEGPALEKPSKAQSFSSPAEVRAEPRLLQEALPEIPMPRPETKSAKEPELTEPVKMEMAKVVAPTPKKDEPRPVVVESKKAAVDESLSVVSETGELEKQQDTTAKGRLVDSKTPLAKPKIQTLDAALQPNDLGVEKAREEADLAAQRVEKAQAEAERNQSSERAQPVQKAKAETEQKKPEAPSPTTETAPKPLAPTLGRKKPEAEPEPKPLQEALPEIPMPRPETKSAKEPELTEPVKMEMAKVVAPAPKKDEPRPVDVESKKAAVDESLSVVSETGELEKQQDTTAKGRLADSKAPLAKPKIQTLDAALQPNDLGVEKAREEADLAAQRVEKAQAEAKRNQSTKRAQPVQKAKAETELKKPEAPSPTTETVPKPLAPTLGRKKPEAEPEPKPLQEALPEIPMPRPETKSAKKPELTEPVKMEMAKVVAPAPKKDEPRPVVVESKKAAVDESLSVVAETGELEKQQDSLAKGRLADSKAPLAKPKIQTLDAALQANDVGVEKAREEADIAAQRVEKAQAEAERNQSTNRAQPAEKAQAEAELKKPEAPSPTIETEPKPLAPTLGRKKPEAKPEPKPLQEALPEIPMPRPETKSAKEPELTEPAKTEMAKVVAPAPKKDEPRPVVVESKKAAVDESLSVVSEISNIKRTQPITTSESGYALKPYHDSKRQSGELGPKIVKPIQRSEGIQLETTRREEQARRNDGTGRSRYQVPSVSFESKERNKRPKQIGVPKRENKKTEGVQADRHAEQSTYLISRPSEQDTQQNEPGPKVLRPMQGDEFPDSRRPVHSGEMSKSSRFHQKAPDERDIFVRPAAKPESSLSEAVLFEAQPKPILEKSQKVRKQKLERSELPKPITVWERPNLEDKSEEEKLRADERTLLKKTLHELADTKVKLGRIKMTEDTTKVYADVESEQPTSEKELNYIKQDFKEKTGRELVTEKKTPKPTPRADLPEPEQVRAKPVAALGEPESLYPEEELDLSAPSDDDEVAGGHRASDSGPVQKRPTVYRRSKKTVENPEAAKVPIGFEQAAAAMEDSDTPTRKVRGKGRVGRRSVRFLSKGGGGGGGGRTGKAPRYKPPTEKEVQNEEGGKKEAETTRGSFERIRLNEELELVVVRSDIAQGSEEKREGDGQEQNNTACSTCGTELPPAQAGNCPVCAQAGQEILALSKTNYRFSGSKMFATADTIVASKRAKNLIDMKQTLPVVNLRYWPKIPGHKEVLQLRRQAQS